MYIYIAMIVYRDRAAPAGVRGSLSKPSNLLTFRKVSYIRKP